MTNDVLVPANAEIVIEGEISTEFLEPEALASLRLHCRAAAQSLLRSEVHHASKESHFCHHHQPDAAERIERDAPGGGGGNYLRFLRDQCNIPGIVEVAFHSIAVRQICVIKMKKINQAHVWQALHSMVGYIPRRVRW